jgi:translation initiation factor 1 (eIF-1/SUI1)
LTLRRETKHRGGKTVVIISGFVDRSAQVLGELEKLLKQRLGCGGSCDPQAGEILIQGDRAAEVAAVLGQLGYEVRGVAKP